jgi:hypothetical protein
MEANGHAPKDKDDGRMTRGRLEELKARYGNRA